MSLEMESYTNKMINLFNDFKKKGVEPLIIKDKLVLVKVRRNLNEFGDTMSVVIVDAPSGSIENVRGIKVTKMNSFYVKED